MKAILTTFFAIALSSAAIAQSPDKALARVRYSFTHLRDTTAKDNPYTENMLLVIGKNASVYTSYDRLNRSLDMQKQVAEQVKNQAGSGGPVSIRVNGTSIKPMSDIDYFYFAKENYLIEEDAPKISWKISKDTASFSGIKCQKATANFKGRKWIAWFAQDLPFQSGPWKLNGLPGLVVEAYDEKKEVVFAFAGMENVNEEQAKAAENSGPVIQTPSGGPGTVKMFGMDGAGTYLGAEIKLPIDAIKTTRKELDKLKEARDKDPQGFMNAQMAANGIQFGGGATMRTTVKPISGNPTQAQMNIINNPIELPETK
jgi:GLPGLI family protein